MAHQQVGDLVSFTATASSVSGTFSCTGFTSTGIDDNADQTVITVDTAEQTTLAGIMQMGGANSKIKMKNNADSAYVDVMQINGASDNVFIGSGTVGASTYFRADANVIGVTLSGASGSELVVFAKDVNMGGIPTASGGASGTLWNDSGTIKINA